MAAEISRAARFMASVGIEDEEVAVFAGDLDRQAGGAQVEEVEALLRIVLFVFFADLNSVSLIIDLFLYSFSSLSRYSFSFFMPSPPCAIIRRFVRGILDAVDKRPTHLYSTQNNIRKKICTSSICCNLGRAMPVSSIPPGGNSASGQGFGGAGAKANFQQQSNNQNNHYEINETKSDA